MRLALAGAGLFGEEHLRALARIEGVEVAAIADINGKAAQGAAERHGVKDWGTDIIPLIDRHRPDGLIIATPGHTHVPLAKAALARGIPVLVEKPVAMTAADAALLAEADAKGPAFVLPGHVLRFSEPHRMIFDVIASGAIGRVLSFASRRYRDDSHALRYTDIDPIMMTMIHDIDLALWMTGAFVSEVLARRSPADRQHRSHTLMTAGGRNGASWSLTTAWTFPGEALPPDRIEIVGEQGGIDFETATYIRQYGTSPRSIDLAGQEDVSLIAEDSCFVDCIRKGKRPGIVTSGDAYAGLQIAEAAMASLREGGIVRLP
ncbi:Gfo/Idh/MocA family protein [Taklimakanibacter lacteus]|uniref:Gfo/Idh/MocA family protein n=1 Tax=Taklimakanibacter lacteus TaxID=2268456 RepID=UPI000E670B38